MTLSPTKQFPDAHLFYGSLYVEKTDEIRDAVHQLLEDNPDMSYTVVGDDVMEQYWMGEDYKEVDASLKTDGIHINVLTDADIIVIPEIRYPLDFAIFHAAATTGKHVFTSMAATNTTLTPKMDTYNRRNGDKILFDLADYTKLNILSAPILDGNVNIVEKLDDTDNSFNFHEVLPFSQENKVNNSTSVVYHNIDDVLGERNLTVFFGRNPVNLGSIIKDTLATFHDNRELRYYAFGKDFHRLDKVNLPKNYRKGKLALEHDGNTVVSASSDADVIIMPLIGNHLDMENLTIALATGKPVIIGINACNTRNVNQLIDYLESTNNIMNPSLERIVGHSSTPKELLVSPAVSRITSYIQYSAVENNEVSVFGL